MISIERLLKFAQFQVENEKPISRRKFLIRSGLIALGSVGLIMPQKCLSPPWDWNIGCQPSPGYADGPQHMSQKGAAFGDSTEVSQLERITGQYADQYRDW
jgi:hypothetical protein